jgi:hypothetical protein
MFFAVSPKFLHRIHVRALLRGRFGAQSGDKTSSLPEFDSAAVYGLLDYSDGLLIVSAFEFLPPMKWPSLPTV